MLQTQDEGEDQNKSQNKNQNKSQDKKSQDETAKKKNMFDKMGKGLEQIHPLHVMNENLKVKSFQNEVYASHALHGMRKI